MGPKTLLSNLDIGGKGDLKEELAFEKFPPRTSNHHSIDLPHAIQTLLKKARFIS